MKDAILEAKDNIDGVLKAREMEEIKQRRDALKKHIAKRKQEIKHHAPLYARAAFKF